MTIWLLLILQLAPSFAVTSGTLVQESGEKVEVGSGTFIPSPRDEKLAKEIVDKNAKIESQKVRIENLENKILKYGDYYKGREDKIEQYYKGEVKKRDERIDDLDSWWPSWGQTTSAVVVTAILTALITREVVR